jgi:hypothetical protein
MESENVFHYEFTFLNKRYAADIVPVYKLNQEERLKYDIKEDSFLVKLITINGIKHFELYVAQNMEWHTQTNDSDIHDEIIQILGKYIDYKTN